MDEYYFPATGQSSSSKTASEKMFDNLNNGLEPEMNPEKDENRQLQDDDSQTSTPSCVSKMDFTLPKYRNNVSPAIDRIMRMMNMPSLITPEDSYSDLPTSTNHISSLDYYCDGENFVVPVAAREHLDVCFSSPRPFVSACKKDSAQSRAKEIDLSLFQDAQKPLSWGWQEITDPLSDPVDFSRYEVK